jgi:hypothetical protein
VKVAKQAKVSVKRAMMVIQLDHWSKKGIDVLAEAQMSCRDLSWLGHTRYLI